MAESFTIYDGTGSAVLGVADTTARADIAAEIARAEAAEALLAPLDSPVFTGTPTTPTASPGTTGDQIASVDFVAAAILASPGGISWEKDCGSYEGSGVLGYIRTAIPSNVDGTYNIRLTITTPGAIANVQEIVVAIISSAILFAWSSLDGTTNESPTDEAYVVSAVLDAGVLVLNMGNSGGARNVFAQAFSPADVSDTYFDGWVFDDVHTAIGGATAVSFKRVMRGPVAVYGGRISGDSGLTVSAGSTLLQAGVAVTGATSSFGTAAAPQLLQVNGYEVTGLLATSLARTFG